MTSPPNDQTAKVVPRLVLLVAALGVAAGGTVLAVVSQRLAAVERRHVKFEAARAVVSQTLRDLRDYRLDLTQTLAEVGLHPLADAQGAQGPAGRERFDQDRVAAGAERLSESLGVFAEVDADKAQAITDLQQGLRQTHRSLLDAWQATAERRRLDLRCQELEDAARRQLQDLSRVVDSQLGRRRLKVAAGLARMRREGADADALKTYAETFRSGRGLMQLSDDLQELALASEQLFFTADSDQLRSWKDNRMRQTLDRLNRNSAQVGANSGEFLAALSALQETLFGEGSRDDPQHQVLLTTDSGLYAQKMAQIKQRSLLAEARGHAERSGKHCRAAEDQLQAIVARLSTAAADSDLAMIRGVSGTLFVFAGVMSLLFLFASGAVFTLVKRTVIRSAEMHRESLEMARIIRQSPSEVYFCDAQTLRFVEVNDGACENTGYSREELLTMGPADLGVDLDARALAAELEGLTDGRARSVEFRCSFRRRSGAAYPVQATAQAAVYNERPVFVAFASDMSVREQLEEQLGRAQKLESIGQLSAGIAHEINTPMQFVSSNAEFLQMAMGRLFEVFDHISHLLLDDGPIDWDQRRESVETLKKSNRIEKLRSQVPAALDETREGIERVVHILGAMKSFSHPGGQARKPVNLNEAVESALIISRNRWKYVAEVATELDTDLPCVPAYIAEFNQVLLNLVVNAADAVKERYGEDMTGRILIRTREVDGMAEVQVEDNGCGMPEEVRRRIFDPFFTTKEVGKGTGQGLAITHDVVVNLHGGRIRVESSPGEGARFVVSLPIDPAEAESPGDTQADSVDAAEAAPV